MTRRSRVLLSLLSLLALALPAFSQTGDLSVSITADERIASASYFGYVVHAAWTGTEGAENVVLEMNVPGTFVSVNPYSAGMTCTQTNPVRCTLPFLAGNQMYEGMFVQVQLPGPGTYTATLTGSTTSPESSTTNNTTSHTVTVAGLRSLRTTATVDPAIPLDPNEEGTMRIAVQNTGEVATNVVLHVTLPEGGAVVSAQPDFTYPFNQPIPVCTIEDGTAVCRVDNILSGGFANVGVRFRAPNRTDGSTFPILSTVDADGEDFEPGDDAYTSTVRLRKFISVSNVADDGSGSLRQTILDANSICATTPCTISLAGIGSVQPSSPLPLVTGNIRIDGGEPHAQIDGSRLPDGADGLVLSGSCEYEVRNLVIRNVPHHAIEARQSEDHASNCAGSFLGFRTGLTIRNTELVANERGIVTKNFDSELANNVIHENRRSGVFIDGAWYSLVHNNVIVNNGASGVFVNNNPNGRFGGIPSGTDLFENTIHGNAEFGIARTRNGLVDMQRNSLARNGVFAYDIDLDLATPNRDSDAGGVPNKPVLLSANYDPWNNQTIIRGVAETTSGFTFDFYASDSRDARGGPQAERYLRSAFLGAARPNFEVIVLGDLRGQWITATLTKGQTLYFLRPEQPSTYATRPSSGQDTSELSEAIQVQ